ncbi:MAG: L-arabinose isomerase, partial [Cellvibrionaceae bacterium]
MITFDDLFKRDYESAKIGVFGCGVRLYWDQFPGLKDKLIGHQNVFEDRLKENAVNVVSGGLVDTPQLAAKIGDRFKREDVDF